MIVLVSDPITNNLVSNLEAQPFLIEGEGRNRTKIYFETQENKDKYIKQFSIMAGSLDDSSSKARAV